MSIEYKIESTSESALDLDEFVLSMRRISTKRKDILNTIGLDSLKSMIDLLNRHIGTGEMHHCLNTDHILHLVGNVEGEIGSGATGAPSNVAEGRIMSNHTVHPLEEVIDTVLCLGREILKGEHNSAAIAGGGCTDLVNNLHLRKRERENERRRMEMRIGKCGFGDLYRKERCEVEVKRIQQPCQSA